LTLDNDQAAINLDFQRGAGRPQVNVAAIFQGDTVQQTKAEIPGKEIALNVGLVPESGRESATRFSSRVSHEETCAGA
jgi:hypothetical protein